MRGSGRYQRSGVKGGYVEILDSETASLWLFSCQPLLIWRQGHEIREMTRLRPNLTWKPFEFWPFPPMIRWLSLPYSKAVKRTSRPPTRSPTKSLRFPNALRVNGGQRVSVPIRVTWGLQSYSVWQRPPFSLIIRSSLLPPELRSPQKPERIPNLSA